MLHQEEYDQYFNQTSPKVLDFVCTLELSIIEKQILESIKPAKLLDVGCGSGNRTFSYYQDNRIDFIGIEKFENYISGSKCPQKILNLCLYSSDFQSQVRARLIELNFEQYDAVMLWGQVINGFNDPDKREIAWRNLVSLITKEQYLVISTLIYPEWYESAAKGRYIKTGMGTPTQYFYSKCELEDIFSSLNLKIDRMFYEILEHSNIRHTFFILKSILSN